ncbi:MAG TPA: DUF4282 domain-containing protein [Anaerolineales bacterium]|jgi:hypothetical protein|nr:DUF4282 domain-containing protein [Anaerolineales bacterium]
MNFRSFLNFERMITPVIITILFWIGLIIVAISALVVFFGGIIGGLNGDGFGSVLGGLFGGPLVFILGGLMVRIYSELLILAFRINETLTDIKNELKKE